MKTTSDSTEGDGEISPEALRALNELLAEGLPEDASEEEAEACMKKFASMPGGEQMLRALNRQLQEGGGELLNSIMGQEVGDLAELEASSITSVPDCTASLVAFCVSFFVFKKGPLANLVGVEFPCRQMRVFMTCILPCRIPFSFLVMNLTASSGGLGHV